jgi:hypothetical protein
MSPPSCSPAVPPPPVCGAVVTTGVREAVTVTLGVGFAVRVTVGVAVTLTVGVTLTVTAGVTLTVGVTVIVVAAGVPRSEMRLVDVGRTELLTVGANVVADAKAEDCGDEQPDTTARPRMAMAPKPTAVSRARGAIPAIGGRTLLRYPPIGE